MCRPWLPLWTWHGVGAPHMRSHRTSTCTFWAYALQLLPRPTPTQQILDRMAERGSVFTADALDEFRHAMDKQARLRGLRLRTQTLHDSVITSATKGALSQPSRPLRPY